MYVHMYICGDVQASMYTCEGQKRKMGVLLGQSPLYSPRQGLSLNLELTVDQTGCCPASPTTPYLCHPPHWGHRHMQQCLASPPFYFYYVYVCGYVHMHSGACRGQRGSDLPGGGAAWYGCWKLNSGLLEEQYMLWTTVLSLEPMFGFLWGCWGSKFRPCLCRKNSCPLSYLPVQHFLEDYPRQDSSHELIHAVFSENVR